MAGRWTDDHLDPFRARDGGAYGDDYPYGSAREARSFDGNGRSGFAARRGGPNRDRVFGERESGVSYGNAPSAGYESPRYQTGGAGKVAPRFGAEDYTQGGRFYGDDSRERVYREEYGQGGRQYGAEPRGYDAGGYSPTRARYHASGFGDPGFDDSYVEPSHRRASGGTGGYDYERGYGNGGRGEARSGRDDARADRFEDAGRSAGQFLHRAGEKVANWFVRGSEGAAYAQAGYDQADHRGRGPQGYKRSDARISDDAHDRLTDDRWLDASNVEVKVSGGEVTLSGSVESRAAKHRAEHLVEDIPGVVHVQNNLRALSGGQESVLGEQIEEAGGPVAGAPALNRSSDEVSRKN